MPALGTSLKCQPVAVLTPALDIHTPPSRNHVLSLAPGYLARIPKYCGRNVGSGQSSTGDICLCGWLAKHPCASCTFKTGEADFAEGISTSAPSGLMCGHTGRRKGFFLFAQRWILAWESGVSVEVLPLRQLPITWGIVATSPWCQVPLYKQFQSQDSLLHMESWRKPSQDLSVAIGCVFMQGKSNFLIQTPESLSFRWAKCVVCAQGFLVFFATRMCPFRITQAGLLHEDFFSWWTLISEHWGWLWGQDRTDTTNVLYIKNSCPKFGCFQSPSVPLSALSSCPPHQAGLISPKTPQRGLADVRKSSS